MDEYKDVPFCEKFVFRRFDMRGKHFAYMNEHKWN